MREREREQWKKDIEGERGREIERRGKKLNQWVPESSSNAEKFGGKIFIQNL